MIKLSKFKVIEGGLVERDPGARLRQRANRAYEQGLWDICEQRIQELYAYYDTRPGAISAQSGPAMPSEDRRTQDAPVRQAPQTKRRRQARPSPTCQEPKLDV